MKRHGPDKAVIAGALGLAAAVSTHLLSTSGDATGFSMQNFQYAEQNEGNAIFVDEKAALLPEMARLMSAVIAYYMSRGFSHASSNFCSRHQITSRGGAVI